MLVSEWESFVLGELCVFLGSCVSSWQVKCVFLVSKMCVLGELCVFLIGKMCSW